MYLGSEVQLKFTLFSIADFLFFVLLFLSKFHFNGEQNFGILNPFLLNMKWLKTMKIIMGSKRQT